MSDDYQDWWWKGVSVNFEEDYRYSKKCIKAYMEEAFRAGVEFAQRQVKLNPVSVGERRLQRAVEEARGGMRAGYSTIEVRDVDVIEVLNRLHKERSYTSKYQWQPFETAPKDGNNFMLLIGGIVELCRWDEEMGQWLHGGSVGLDGDGCYWMPLPQPPKS